ncbi:MAG: SIMPL domain-containing protein [Fusobacteriaceae bacterium]
MNNKISSGAIILGISIIIGLSSLGYLLGNSFIETKKLDRTIIVKGLSEKEVLSDKVVFPIQFKIVGNNLNSIYEQLKNDNQKIITFLIANGLDKSEISISSPNIEDKALYQSENNKSTFRYIATQLVTIYSTKVQIVYNLNTKIGELLKENVASEVNSYTVDYSYNNLNSIKPQMIEEATKNARDVAEKFAQDSKSSLGKIKRANQGQFIITDSDIHNPHIKKIRIVSTIEYYLVD